MAKSSTTSHAAFEPTPCERCPLRPKGAFRAFTDPELNFMSKFKSGELHVQAGAEVFTEDTDSAHLYTILSGWAFRHKTLPDGRRQILNFGLPGDFLGLQASVYNKLNHSAEALTDMTLCLFERKRLWQLYEHYPELAFDLTWLASREERILDEHLLTVGRRSALERIAHLLLLLFHRAERLDLVEDGKLDFPMTQQHFADALGLSLVHTNKTLRRIAKSGAARWQDGVLLVSDRARLAELCNYDFEDVGPRPLI